MMQGNVVFKEGESPQQVYTRRRRYPRFSVEGIDISSKMIFTEGIKISNISVGGVCIIAKKLFNPGNKVLVRLKSERFHGPLNAMTVWRKPGGSIIDASGKPVPVYKAGIQFKNISSEALVYLKDFMRISGVPEEKTYSDAYKPSALRYVITNNEEAVLHYPETCIVKKISLSGMLVETNRELEIDRKYPMALFIPNEDHPIKFRCRIASQIPLQETNSFDTGIEFLNLKENDKLRLKRFIAYLSVKQIT
ncbi:MAG: PilZ domain-containing protein [Nitrospirae bacterium]|nr:PilZ domain-containing protein [Nitrospirota bacterium]